MKKFLSEMVNKSHFIKRMTACFFAVILMGFALSWLIMIDWGTDPYTAMNLGISRTLGISFGSWQALFNLAMMIFVIIFDKKKIGFGTLFNMILVGYSCDFFSYIWSILLPNGLSDNFIFRILLMIIMLTIFVIVASIYMTVDLGMSPYDALPIIINNCQKKLSFRVIRILFDLTVAFIGFLFGATIGIVTIIMAFALGPVITLLQPYVERMFAD